MLWYLQETLEKEDYAKLLQLPASNKPDAFQELI